jgi:hypothetical protein
MTPIRTNKPLFFNLDGEPLTGKIYIGQPNTDPRTSPKTVTFEDSGGAQFTASQPLTTIFGRVVYNGKPIVHLIDGEYSLLMFDSAGAQVDYTPSITPPTGGDTGGTDFSEVARVGLTLGDIKTFDVSVSESVRNIGKATAQDELGADWIVVSNTGNPADDIDLIDFENGLQGQRLNNVTYRNDVTQTGTFLYDAPQTIVSTSDATSYRNTWTNVDISSAVPDEASSAIVRVRLEAQYPTSTISNTIGVFANVRKSGSSATNNFNNSIGIDENRTDANSRVESGFVSEITVPLDPGVSSDFDIYVLVNDPTFLANNTSPALYINVMGYTVNYEDVAS